MPSHTGVDGNEGGDKCAKKGVDLTLIGLEPVCGVSYSVVRKTGSKWVSHEWQKRWNRDAGHTQSNRMLKESSSSNAADGLRLGRKELHKVVKLLIGHWLCNTHLVKIGIDATNPHCRICG